MSSDGCGYVLFGYPCTLVAGHPQPHLLNKTRRYDDDSMTAMSHESADGCWCGVDHSRV